MKLGGVVSHALFLHVLVSMLQVQMLAVETVCAQALTFAHVMQEELVKIVQNQFATVSFLQTLQYVLVTVLAHHHLIVSAVTIGLASTVLFQFATVLTELVQMFALVMVVVLLLICAHVYKDGMQWIALFQYVMV